MAASIANRDRSLAMANSSRISNALARARIAELSPRQGVLEVASLIESGSQEIETSTVYELVFSVRRMGRKKLAMHHSKIYGELKREVLWLRCRDLTDRERRLVADNLRRWTDS